MSDRLPGGPFPRECERCFPTCSRHPDARGYQFQGDDMWCSECWRKAAAPPWTRAAPTEPQDAGWWWGCNPQREFCKKVAPIHFRFLYGGKLFWSMGDTHQLFRPEDWTGWWWLPAEVPPGPQGEEGE